MNLILKNARVVSMSSGADGYQPSSPQNIVIENGKIVSISCSNHETLASELEQVSVDGSLDYVTYDCKNKLITPGLIDCHTHLVFAGNRANEFEQRLNGVSYTDIAKQGGGILATVTATRAAQESELVEMALPRLDGLLRSGVTSIEVKSGYGLTLDDELKMLRAAKALENHRRIKITTTLLAAHAVPPEYKEQPDSYIDLVCQEIIPKAAEQGLADAVDVLCESYGFNLEQTERLFVADKKHELGNKGPTK